MIPSLPTWIDSIFGRFRSFDAATGAILVFVVFLMLVSSAEAQEDAEKPDSRFGVAEAFWSPEDARELGVGWERILFYWKEIQPAGPTDWNTLHVREEWLDEAGQKGREVVGLLKNTAPWASEDGTEAGLPKGLNLALDDPENYWANFTRKTARYYAPLGVHHWIIWNEPEIDPDTYGYEFAGSDQDYYRLLKVAYQVIKEEDPNAVIHLAGITWWHDPDFLERLFEIASLDAEAESGDLPFDVISLHIYFRPETVLTIIQEVQSLLTKYGLEKEIWINETNAPPNMDPEWPVNRPAFDVDLEQQAWFVVQSAALALSKGAERFAVYKLIDTMLPEGGESFGLVRQDDSHRPAFSAYETTIDYLSGFEDSSLKVHPHYYVASFSAEDRVVRIMWARSQQDVVLQVPPLAEEAKLINYLGESAAITAGDESYRIFLPGAVCYDECLIGGEPVVLVEQVEDQDIELIETAVAVGSAKPTPADFATATAHPTVTPTASQTPTSTPTATQTPAPSPTLVPSIAPASPMMKASPTTAATSTTSITKVREIPTPEETAAAALDLHQDAENSGNDLGSVLGFIFIGTAIIIGILLIIYLLLRRQSS